MSGASGGLSRAFTWSKIWRRSRVLDGSTRSAGFDAVLMAGFITVGFRPKRIFLFMTAHNSFTLKLRTYMEALDERFRQSSGHARWTCISEGLAILCPSQHGTITQCWWFHQTRTIRCERHAFAGASVSWNLVLFR